MGPHFPPWLGWRNTSEAFVDESPELCAKPQNQKAKAKEGAGGGAEVREGSGLRTCFSVLLVNNFKMTH